jgi:digeranylgeranylglycerophospholipid reductase
METVTDVAVVGGGPCGSFSALHLAKRGVGVTVFEEHDEIGVPCHCAGHLSITGLKRLGLYSLPTGIVENTFKGATFHSPHRREFSVRFKTPVTCVVNRALFDKFIAEKAEEAGARFFLGSRVESLVVENGFVKGVVVKQKGVTSRWKTKIVVDAEGISARLSRQAGLPSPNRSAIVKGVETEVEDVRDVQQDMVEVFLGRNYAPGFFAWLIPKADGKAKVGLATRTGNPKELLQKLMLKHPVASGKLRTARTLQTIFHPVTLGGPIPKTYSNGFLVVGDAASQVKPTTGGGVVLELTCAGIAAGVADEALRRSDLSSGFLREYQRRCEAALGFDMRAMLRVRGMLDALSDRQLDNVIGFCARYGVDRVLIGVEDTDLQGHSLLSLLHHPQAFLATLYLLYVQFSAKAQD